MGWLLELFPKIFPRNPSSGSFVPRPLPRLFGRCEASGELTEQSPSPESRYKHLQTRQSAEVLPSPKDGVSRTEWPSLVFRINIVPLIIDFDNRVCMPSKAEYEESVDVWLCYCAPKVYQQNLLRKGLSNLGFEIFTTQLRPPYLSSFARQHSVRY